MKPVPDVKHLKVKDFPLSSEQLQQFFVLYNGVTSCFRHDLNGDLAFIAGAAEVIRVLKFAPEKSAEMVEAILNTLPKIRERADWLVRNFGAEDPGEPLVTKPGLIATKLTSKFEDVEISETSDRSLEIVYPEHVFQAILEELIKNAKKHNDAKTQTLVSWKMEEDAFDCEVHDSGKGFAAGYAFHDQKESSGQGLRILNRLLYFSNGLLLPGRSQVLGGAVVRFRFPVLGVYSKGSCAGRS
jgi:K+-sensing histidine kinase KdpD